MPLSSSVEDTDVITVSPVIVVTPSLSKDAIVNHDMLSVVDTDGIV